MTFRSRVPSGDRVEKQRMDMVLDASDALRARRDGARWEWVSPLAFRAIGETQPGEGSGAKCSTLAKVARCVCSKFVLW